MVIKKCKVENPTVSIICLCYNHEKWLRECLDSLVNQETSFPYEIIIHDDKSLDHSVDILLDYHKKYPEIITLLLQDENQYSRGVKILGRFLFPQVRGKYIAICECDDYYIDTTKLQKQYDFMEAHTDYSLCCHAAMRIDASTHNELSVWDIQGGDRDLSVAEMIRVGGLIMPTNSMFFISDPIKKEGMPEFFYNAPVGDTPIMIFLAFKGKTKYMNEVMSAYRVNNPDSAVGRMSSDTLERRKKRSDKALKMYELMDDYSERKYHEHIQIAISRTKFDYYFAALDFKELAKSEYETFRNKNHFFWTKCVLRKIAPNLYGTIAAKIKHI